MLTAPPPLLSSRLARRRITTAIMNNVTTPSSQIESNIRAEEGGRNAWYHIVSLRSLAQHEDCFNLCLGFGDHSTLPRMERVANINEYPLSSWKPISFTLPGSTRIQPLTFFNTLTPIKAAESTAALEKRASSGNLYAACSKLNMASKYKNFPINGYLYSGGAVGSGAVTASVGGASSCALDGTGDANCGSQGAIFTEQVRAHLQTMEGQLTHGYMKGSDAASAYDCCVQAQNLQDSAFFFFTSNPSQFVQKCIVVRTNYCSYSKYSSIIEAAAFNGSAPRGTSYYNYIGNGRCVSQCGAYTHRVPALRQLSTSPAVVSPEQRPQRLQPVDTPGQMFKILVSDLMNDALVSTADSEQGVSQSIHSTLTTSHIPSH
ncbi:uncharacterized protein MYCFIDRAFT_170096 [Pseudocercospora fijiensis CIRAD86]|uniref:Uncharacterized protein n=1 Tax=Pseudocercospora fijiensis (strain CIRAD86) TaxID=383855 RepID=N1Q9L0_PSEFD|nr:uncharacterized protein MYCFIDRAFT_170096 [Pseudocercospora fijiensis CIRAD86]EME88486.1 hypothetical protein MYCFIDRAFT_170096 [Pseudocercospora fijiensis CIRAD86]